MSGTTEVLQEYLVKLGYQIDAVSNRKFEDGLSKVGKTVFGVGTKIAGVVASIEAASAAFAYSMRKIYFQSELANTSATNLRALGFAGKQIGADLESAVHGMGQAMRLNPGLQGLVESFGVKVTGRDTSDVMIDFVKALKDMPEFAGAQYAAMFGIDPDTYHQMINHMDELTAKKQKLVDIYKDSGVDPDAAKRTILEYTSAIDELEARLSILGQGILIKLQPTFKDITVFLNNSIQGWMDIVAGKRQLIFDKYTAQVIGGDIKSAYDKYGKYIPTPANAGRAVSNLIDKYLPRGARNHNLGNLNYAGQRGATKEAGPNGRFAVFKTDEDGEAALADQIKRYQDQGVNTIQKIISKYAPKNENKTEAYIESVARSLGIKPDQALDFNKNPELMKQIMKAIIKVESGSKYVNEASIDAGIRQSKFGQATSARLGTEQSGKTVSLHFESHIDVHGSDPHSTGKAVEKAQTRIYGDLIRNTRGALA